MTLAGTSALALLLVSPTANRNQRHLASLEEFQEAAEVFRAASQPLDVPGGEATDQLPMQIYGCNGSGAQVWLLNPISPSPLVASGTK